jgi:hypothetical protein
VFQRVEAVLGVPRHECVRDGGRQFLVARVGVAQRRRAQQRPAVRGVLGRDRRQRGDRIGPLARGVEDEFPPGVECPAVQREVLGDTAPGLGRDRLDAGEFSRRVGVRGDDDGVGGDALAVGLDGRLPVGGVDGTDRRPRLDVRAGLAGAVGQLGRDGAHPVGGDDRLAPREHGEGVPEDAGVGRQRAVEGDPAVERFRELRQERLGEAPPDEVLADRLVGAVEQRLGVLAPERPPEPKRRELVHERHVGVQRRRDGVGGCPERVSQRRAVGRPGDGRARREPPEVERVQVQFRPDGGVAGKEHLEAPVEREPVDLARPDAAADRVRALEDGHVVAQPGQVARRDQPRQSTTGDSDVGHGRGFDRPS